MFLFSVVLFSFQAVAAEKGLGSSDYGYIVVDKSNQGIVNYHEAPAEPAISPVKFLKQDPPATLRDRVDRLLHGIKVDIPSEYDYYGYELRRYMAHISGPSVFGNKDRINEELGNIRKARIILKYWHKELVQESDEISRLIETENAPANIRSSFKYNSSLAMAFISECQGWIQKNEELLQFLLDKQGTYGFDNSKFNFKSNEDRRNFAAKFNAAQQAREYINQYVPFANMVY